MKLKIHVNGQLQVNTYLFSLDNKTCYIIDPGSDSEGIIKEVSKWGYRVNAILLTHAHFDHIGAVNQLVDHYKCSVYLHPLDFIIARNPKLNYSSSLGESYKIDFNLLDITSLNSDEIEIIPTPGHTEGSICIYLKKEKVLFSGDTLFANGVGRTDLFSGNSDKLTTSLAKILRLDGEVLVYPGHEEFTTIKDEKSNLML